MLNFVNISNAARQSLVGMTASVSGMSFNNSDGESYQMFTVIIVNIGKT